MLFDLFIHLFTLFIFSYVVYIFYYVHCMNVLEQVYISFEVNKLY